MDRRAFLTGIGSMSAGLAGAAAPEAQQGTGGARSRYYEFRFYRLRQGDQPRRMSQFASQRLLPLMQKHKFGPAGFFDVNMGAHSPSLVGLMSYSSLSEREEVWGKLGRDPEWHKAVTELESVPEPPFVRADSFLARATAYAPELAPSSADQKPRYFELRVYDSPTERQLRALHERFGGPEIRIFHRVGIHPILYGEMVVGPGMPNLVYLTPFASLAEREKAWAAFGADPEWQKVREESVQKAGQIVSNISITILRATAYSPIR